MPFVENKGGDRGILDQAFREFLLFRQARFHSLDNIGQRCLCPAGIVGYVHLFTSAVTVLARSSGQHLFSFASNVRDEPHRSDCVAPSRRRKGSKR
jgi:hypothetical protein